MKEHGEKLFDDIVNGRCLEDPSLLVPFILLSFAVSKFAFKCLSFLKLIFLSFKDLKTYNFFYWLAFVSSIEPILHEDSPPQKLSEVFSAEDIERFSESYRDVEDQRLVSFFLCNENLEITFLKDLIKHDEPDNNFKDVNLDTTYFCFSDPSEYGNPGWPLRNYILLLLKLCPVVIGKQIKVISIRQDQHRSDSSLIFTINLEGVKSLDKSDIKWTGWERNNQGKLLPKTCAMGDSIDPVKLSDHFSSLNLKLMKWRLLPNLNLDIIKSQKCLLFGAGTLGCAIARDLLSWGVTNITIADSGSVSFSNPVRQCLYTHDDAFNHKPKATTAAERLKMILPSVNSSGHVLRIPMPGHSISDSMREETIENIQFIKNLIQSHDVLFLLTDSRESRWLPTLLGAFYGKVMITDKTF